jgi:myo-inositol-1(or 4)-monophosphatase
VRDLAELADITTKAIQLAHDILTSSTLTSVRRKGDRDFVTDVDLTIEREVRAYLAQVTPEIGFLGEEEGHASTADSHSVWTLDPIDGTTNYIHGLPLYAVSLALVHQGDAITAAIDAPALGLRYSATRDQGVYCNGRAIRASATAQLRSAVVAIGDYAVGHGAAERNERRLRLTAALATRVERIRMLGSAALDLAFLAEGTVDASITLSNKPWDMAAGVLIAREAGATVTDVAGAPHSLTSAETVAVAANLADPLHELLREMTVP